MKQHGSEEQTTPTPVLYPLLQLANRSLQAQRKQSFEKAAAWGETWQHLCPYLCGYRENEVWKRKKPELCSTMAVSSHVKFLGEPLFQAQELYLHFFLFTFTFN